MKALKLLLCVGVVLTLTAAYKGPKKRDGHKPTEIEKKCMEWAVKNNKDRKPAKHYDNKQEEQKAEFLYESRVRANKKECMAANGVILAK